MKKIISLLLISVLVISCAVIPASAVDKVKLPFELIPPKTVSMSKVSQDDQTDMNLTYSMEKDMIGFMQDCEDEEKKAELFKEMGVENLWIDAQIDWALDDKNDWHHTEFWDDNEATRYFGIGYDKDGHPRTCEWDVTSLLLYPQTTNDCWITRYAGNPEDPSDTRWNGETYEDEIHCIGMKDVLKEGQYEIKHNDENEAYITIDYNKHTLYARMRYYVTVSYTDNEGNPASYYMFSEWSDIASYGKDGDKWTPYTAETLDAPIISDGYITGEIFNDYPVAAYTLTIPEDLAKGMTKVEGFGGYVSIEAEARIKGTDKWLIRQGDFIPKAGKLTVDILALAGAGKPIYKDTEIELRTRYFCSQRNGYNTDIISEFYSPYSNVISFKTDKDYFPSQGSTVPDATEPDNDGGDNPPRTDEEPKIGDLSGGASKSQVNKFITGLKTDNDPKGSTFGILSAKQKKAQKNSISITWNKVKGAKSYVIYANKCGKNNSYKYLTTVSGTSYTQKKLKKGTYYKYLVTAFNGNGTSIATSKTLHIATKGRKFGNFKTVTTAAKKDKLSLKKGKTFKLKAKAVRESKKLKVNVHRTMKYESSNPKVASVSSKGAVKAVKKGSCFVYAYAQSGAYRKIKVTVK